MKINKEQEEYRKKEKEEYRKSRNNFIWFGIILLIISKFIPEYWDAILYVPGSTFIFTGCYFWTKYKNISPRFTLFGFIAPIGFIPLALIKSKAGKEGNQNGK